MKPVLNLSSRKPQQKIERNLRPSLPACFRCCKDPLILSFSPRGEGTPLQRARPDSLSPSASACGYGHSKVASSPRRACAGEGWGEGGLWKSPAEPPQISSSLPPPTKPDTSASPSSSG